MRKALPLLLFLTSCASSPQFYPNEKLKSVGKEGAKRDVEECTALADDYVSGKGKQVAEGAGKGAVVGGATGAVAGAFSHNILGGGLFGSAIGAVAGGTSRALSPNQVKRNFINHCLQERGYKVVGWD